MITKGKSHLNKQNKNNMNETASRKVLKVNGERDSAEVVDFKII